MFSSFYLILSKIKNLQKFASLFFGHKWLQMNTQLWLHLNDKETYYYTLQMFPSTNKTLTDQINKKLTCILMCSTIMIRASQNILHHLLLATRAYTSFRDLPGLERSSSIEVNRCLLVCFGRSRLHLEDSSPAHS